MQTCEKAKRAMRVEACSVMRRMAMATLPCFVSSSISCMMYTSSVFCGPGGRGMDGLVGGAGG